MIKATLHEWPKLDPNQDTIRLLEDILALARTGQIHSILYTVSYDDQSVSSGWCLDGRARRRTMLGELRYLEHELLTNIGLEDGDSVLCTVLDER